MASYALIHGAGDSAWYWHLVAADLRARGHAIVAVDLPCEDEAAGLQRYRDTVVNAIGELPSDRSELVVVAQSLGGYSAPLVCAQLPVSLLVLVAGMVPSPRETAEEMFTNTGYEEAVAQHKGEHDGSPAAIFYHDVPPELATEALARERRQALKPSREPWPLDAWPEVQTRYLLCRADRLFPADWARQVVQARLGLTPTEMDSGHCPALSHPQELVERLEAFRLDRQ
jgi:pimeloyl-ACP methyl ester carboxylesterase